MTCGMSGVSMRKPRLSAFPSKTINYAFANSPAALLACSNECCSYRDLLARNTRVERCMIIDEESRTLSLNYAFNNHAARMAELVRKFAQA